MECPRCGDRMDIGVIQSAREIFWSDKRNKVFFTSNESKGDISIASGWNGCAIEAHICKKCSRVIIDY